MADEAVTETEEQKAAEVATTDETLGESGKKALESERAARKAAEDEQKKLATKLKEIEDRDKSEADKAAERLAEAEKKAIEVEARATRAEVSAATGVPVKVLAGPESSSTEHIQAFAAEIAAYVVEASKKNPTGPVIPNQGKQPESAAAANADDWLRELARK